MTWWRAPPRMRCSSPILQVSELAPGASVPPSAQPTTAELGCEPRLPPARTPVGEARVGVVSNQFMPEGGAPPARVLLQRGSEDLTCSLPNLEGQVERMGGPSPRLQSRGGGDGS